MANFYFTYGNEGHPFEGGWSKVVANDELQARNIFKAVHPNPNNEFIWCSSIYDEETFKSTDMYVNGNYGNKCHEIIRVDVSRDSDTGKHILSNDEICWVRDSHWYDNEMRYQRRNTVMDIIDEMVSKYKEDGEFELTDEDDEWEGLNDLLCDRYDDDILNLVKEIANGNFYDAASECVEEIIEERKKVYSVPVDFSGRVNFIVRATSEEEAEDYVGRLDSWILNERICAFINDYGDLDYDVAPYHGATTELTNTWEYDECDVMDADE